MVRSLRIPEGEAEQRLRQELAVALYARGLLSLGKASELSGTSRFRFSELLTQQNIPRQYGEEELAEDLKYASGEQHLTPYPIWHGSGGLAFFANNFTKSGFRRR